jgi:hypothetical protein
MGVVEVLDPVRPTKTGGWKVDVSRGERNGRVSSEWFNRPDDERYLSLDDLWASVKGRSERSRSQVVQTASLRPSTEAETGRQAPCDMGATKAAIETSGEASHSPQPVSLPATTRTTSASCDPSAAVVTSGIER